MLKKWDKRHIYCVLSFDPPDIEILSENAVKYMFDGIWVGFSRRWIAGKKPCTAKGFIR